MSKHTPLTDEQVKNGGLTTSYQAHANAEPDDWYVHADFARKLETDRAELLEALEKLVNEADHGNPFCSIGHLIEHVVPEARALIAKVKGE